MSKKKFNELLAFNNSAIIFMIEKDNLNTKLFYAVKKVKEQYVDKVFKEYNGKNEDIRIDNCYTNEKSVIEYDIVKDGQGNETRKYKYTKESLKKKNREQRELLEEYELMEFDVKPFIVSELPGNLTPGQKGAFEGFVLKAGSAIAVSSNGVTQETGGEGELETVK